MVDKEIDDLWVRCYNPEHSCASKVQLHHDVAVQIYRALKSKIS